ncbi:deoxyribonuclease IV [Staphylococcus haemolyticus]|uniref:deoxyribonuclease IV n=1 Tax=Staphylococcus haemolyticus TaxID=1283 RepID=UPI00069D0841|nr:deoxyribonuclease IV [Staphylococcus haemolyticus]MCH4417519.1 deoxyribonuclease IV [Staphylococcus haemolyticus]MCH4431580.1 deoxyribonuclease IV [Staphylococcus haemolyticus]MCH4506645.1 deoxyribonuclease IV [Staphylococcus haemolyticus]MCK6069625.1 deoxyribonuclease IV [Staphylococcus haemolyticus]MCK6111599.1 deoxyribonuclease IV [Staphylococcus haemolyticus]
MLLGSHVSMSGKKMLEGSAEEAHKFGESTFMIYTGAPQNTRRKSIEDLNIEKGHEAMDKYGLSNLVVHAPYIINIANTTKPEVFQLGVDFLQNEIKRTQALGAKDIVLHPGSHVGAGADKGIQQIIKGLNEVLTHDNDVRIALETMAGKGSEVGRTFEEIAQIIDGVTHNDRLSICFDTCHTHDAGYNIKEDFDGVLNEFDKIIGLDRIKVVHVNDSKNEQGAHKDRHENIGFGHIGFDALNYVVHHDVFKDIPKILETPYVGEDKKNKKPPYKFEIEMLKAQQFDSELKDKILQQ